jgi:hypothetical protein
VKRRVSRRMAATIDGSEGCEVPAREIVRVARAVGSDGRRLPLRRRVHATHRPVRMPPPMIVVVSGDPESTDDLVVGVAPVLRRCALTVEDVQEIAPAPPGSAAAAED